MEDVRNRVFNQTIPVGKNNPISLHTNEFSIYRITGMSQIVDIVNSGFVRPKEGKAKGGHTNEVFWTLGGDNLYYFDKRPVLETSIDNLKNNQLGALSIDDLTSIWIFDNESSSYIDRFSDILEIYNTCKNTNYQITEDVITNLLDGNNFELWKESKGNIKK